MDTVSWEEALDLIASELKRVYSEYGPECDFRSVVWLEVTGYCEFGQYASEKIAES